MIVHQRPGMNAEPRSLGLIARAGQKISTILIVVNDISALDAPQHQMMQRPPIHVPRLNLPLFISFPALSL